MWNSLSLGLRGRGKSRFPVWVQESHQLSQDSPGQRADVSAVEAISGIVLGAEDRRYQGMGKHGWDLLGAFPTSWHSGVVPADISHS